MGAIIAQLIIALGPSAIGLIQHLVTIWNTPTLTPDQVLQTTAVLGTTYEQYIQQAGGKLPAPVATTNT